ncbi:glutathione-dependent formaldehyde dehydrogenase [Pontibacter sp. E15-1]|uniref:zinc-dependent alcohol dehydrogenase n=1 Tax=Pontibacter sp. E15-1 TaxID=2919918 RepID=UPI001F4F3889|nr:zinc-dependent alcohol dehydrogenase [Pontibacter sp. E15-1]MCJ8164011.1 glutathione-dependent formaldehyde dehydrogenase [Pontibacter sp. E15-1]
MKAAVFHKMKDIRVDNVEDPKILDPRDAIIRVTSTAICGSDLHIYNGMIPQASNMVMGHEFMGIVEETGAQVKNIKKGDRVIVPFPISCGSCFFCQHGHYPHCENSNPDHYGPEGGLLTQKGAALYGYTDLYGGYAGGQAEFVRVPFADVGPVKISDQFTDEQVLFLTDIFPTGYSAVHWGEVKGGETVAVFGCGPVGLMAQKVAWIKGAKRVIGIDLENYRLDMAQRSAKSETINLKDMDPIEAIREMTGGRGADVCIDAVGMEADKSLLDRAKSVVHLEKGTINALQMCFSAVRRGGIVSIVGVYGSPYDNFPLYQIFDKGLTLKMGQAPVQLFVDELYSWVDQGKIVLDDIITHTLPLDQASYAYDIFNKKEDNCVKVVLKP